MMTLNLYQGYKCEFLVSVPEHFYCGKCSFVARSPILTICCTETYCQDCIASIQQQDRVCPACGEEDFATIKAVKYLRQMETLQVHCSMKERGCGWSGTLEQLDTHLDPDQDNCQYVDTKCPLNCHMTISKKKVEQHVAQHCAKRPHVCQHCGFKATYEEVVDTHLPECKYVALQCPNRCGVTCERGDMEDHMKICQLEEVECKFSDFGCDERFVREGQDKHDEQNVHKHILLAASANEKMKRKLQELEQKLQEYELKFHKQEQQQQQNQDQLIVILREQDEKLQAYDQNLREVHQEQEKMALQLQEKDQQIECLQRYTNFRKTFVVEHFSEVKQTGWKSRATYLRMGGCKFSVSVDYVAHDLIRFSVSTENGVFDKELKWPYYMRFTLEILNQKGGSNLSQVFVEKVQQGLFYKVTSLQSSKIGDYLRHDSLHFSVLK